MSLKDSEGWAGKRGKEGRQLERRPMCRLGAGFLGGQENGSGLRWDSSACPGLPTITSAEHHAETGSVPHGPPPH